MHLIADAIVLSVRAHGEHGAVARALTRVDGVQPGYVRGGHARRLRPVLQPGNMIRGAWRARTDEQLAALTPELLHSRAALHHAALPAAALAWLAALTTAALPEAQPFPRLFDALSGVFDAIEAAPSARGWAGSMARYELLLLAELGFGLDLSACVSTGASDDLAFVSPKSGAAVSREAAAGYEARLFALPAFLIDGGPAEWPDVLSALALTGHFLTRDVLIDRRRDPLAARERLMARLQRAVA
ncbi:DNA repair protein RecO [Sphingomonas sp. Leaf231]|uniref:DNA repair protein RecO n=1 Tax=Sphingomonas sp. Leaf231 TaxID=1736301 RepID=UPI0006F99A85|nr:DNA repair protein RecO [Sphingomonas sp. Leaf231]KQN91145.1 DNA repair protein RecO [Sphingomonas sp. Leaf231]